MIEGLMETMAYSMGENGQITNEVICKIIKAYPMDIVSVEPGVEIAKGLTPTIDATIKHAVNSRYDVSDISRAIFIGAFRCDRSLVLEAHKTIRLLTQQIIHSIFNYRGDMQKAVQGILGGVSAIALEHRLNIHTATMISKEDIMYALNKVGVKSEEIQVLNQGY